jgi:hypothetical protein
MPAVVVALSSVWLLVYAVRKGLVVPPLWRRTSSDGIGERL